MPALQPPAPFADGFPSSSPYSYSNHAATPIDPFTASSTNPNNPNGDNPIFASHMSTNDPSFDILDWHPAYQSCQRFFLDHAQYEPGTQAVCALINIRLPSQWPANPVMSWSGTSTTTPTPSATPPSLTTAGSSNNTSISNSNSSGFPSGFPPHARPSPQHPPKLPSPGHSRGGAAAAGGSSSSSSYNASPDLTTAAAAASASLSSPPPFISAVPYIRRLVVTGFDRAPILHGFFGDDWARGVGPLVECERRNYLFAARGSDGWARCKQQYDSGSGAAADESVPFLRPLDDARPEELVAADQAWRRWRATMEGWSAGEGGGGVGSMVDGGGAGGGGSNSSSRGTDGSRPFAEYQRRRRRDVDDVDGNRMADGEVDGYR